MRVEARPRGDIRDDRLIAAIIEDIDTGVGVLLEGLEELGLDENTCLIYLGDNRHRLRETTPCQTTAPTIRSLLTQQANVRGSTVTRLIRRVVPPQ